MPVDRGVYLLLRHDEVIYVGQSIRMKSRIESHKVKGVDFDRVIANPISIDTSLDNCEADLILKYKPMLNIALPSKQSKYYSIHQLMRKLKCSGSDMNRFQVVKVLRSSKIAYFEFNFTIYFYRTDVDRILLNPF